MIRVIAGYMGTGKSLYAVRWIYKHRKQFATILTNSPISLPDVEVIVDSNPLQQVQYVKRPILLFLDEAHLLMDARRAMSKRNVQWTHLLTLIRKLDTEIILTTQSIAQLDIRLQFFLRTYWEAKGLKWLVSVDGDLEPYFVYDQYKIVFDPFTGERQRFYQRTEVLWYPNAAKYFSLYDTNFIPEFPGEGEEHQLQTVDPAQITGVYNSIGEVLQKLNAMGIKAHRKNYKDILARLGLSLSLAKKSDRKRQYVIGQEQGSTHI